MHAGMLTLISGSPFFQDLPCYLPYERNICMPGCLHLFRDHLSFRTCLVTWLIKLTLHIKRQDVRCRCLVSLVQAPVRVVVFMIVSVVLPKKLI